MDLAPVTVFERFQSHSEGLTENEVKFRLEKFGPNIIKGKKKKPLILQFLEEFTDLMVLILIGAAIISFFSHEKKDTIVILVIVLLNAIIGFIQKFKAERAIEALKKLLTPKARVLRKNQELIIEAKDMVPGDILILNEGDKISADALIIENHELALDEAVLTGESVPVRKGIFDLEKHRAQLSPEIRVFTGTQVTHGSARAIILATGMNTEFGKIAYLTTATKKDKTPLQQELHGIGIFVGKITLGISIFLVIIGLFLQKKAFMDTLLFAASVAVAAVPEGLPATVTIALALGVQRLAKKNAIVRQLASVETLGSTTVICSDKTGTLTKNEMTVKEAIFGRSRASIHGVGYEPIGRLTIHEEKSLACFTSEKSQLERLSQIAGLCNNAHLYARDGKWIMIGDPTEGALLTFVEKSGFSAENFRKCFKQIFEIPFDSIRKRMTVVVQDVETRKVYAFVKGAPETLLPLCTHLTGEMQNVLQQKNEGMAGRALRVMAFAFKEISPEIQRTYHGEEIEKDLTFSGFVGMIDPPREEVKEAVKLTQKAGIKVYIVTGDHGLTASAIAKELGLIGAYHSKIITGSELDKISDEKLLQLLEEKTDILFSRVNPSHKLRIVSVLKAKGEVVAVTGDGVNDAPAIKRADIGIAMGLTGTDVTREAANMVLADDSFATIVSAIREGRVIYENLKKFIFYIFSSNIGEIIAVFVPILFFMPQALTPILILSVNVGTDLLPALALGVDPPEIDIMNRKPRDPKSRILNQPFMERYLFIGFLTGIIVVAGYLLQLSRMGWFWGETLSSIDYRYLKSSTFAFVLLIIIQMVNALNARSDHHSLFTMGIFSNRKLWAAIGISVFLTVAFVHIPPLQKWLDVVALDGKEWLMIIGLSMLLLLAEETRKFLRARLRRYRSLRSLSDG